MEISKFSTHDHLEKSNFSPAGLSPYHGKNKEILLFEGVQGAMHYIPNFSEACIAILDAIIESMRVDNCSLMLKDPLSNELLIRSARGKNEGRGVYYSDPATNRKGFKIGEGIAGWVFEKGQAVILNDPDKDHRFVKTPGLNNMPKSILCFPIREKEEVVGVLNVSHSKKGAFSDRDKLIFAYVSNQIGAALTSSHFFSEIEEIRSLIEDSQSPMTTKNVVPVSEDCSSVEIKEMTLEDGVLISASEKMRQIREIIHRVADTDMTVLIEGESGVGKEVVARTIHSNSLRYDKPFVKVNCAALPQELLESELFGYEKGAFTGAYHQKPGKFELANSGTIFLDEIAEISPSLQAKLLQVLQDREFSKLGGKKDVRVDVRVIAATNRNIEEVVKKGRFRKDLYYRLNVANIVVPPLRERKEEIPIFVDYFLDKFAKKYNREVKPLPAKMMRALLQCLWPGNVRELENVIQRFVVLGKEEPAMDELDLVTKKDPGSPIKEPTPRKAWPSLKELNKEAIVKAESEVILKALGQTNWNRKKAAGLLNISYKGLLYKIKEYGVDRR